MTQKLPFKEPGRAHKRRNNTGRLTFHFLLFVLLGIALLALGVSGRVKLHSIYEQQLLSRRSDTLITDTTNLVKTTAEALAGTDNSLRTKISSGLSTKSRSVKNTAAQMLTDGSSDQETLEYIVDTLSQAAVSKLKDDDEAQSALKAAVNEKLAAEHDSMIATVLADTNEQIQSLSIEDVRRTLTMQTPGYTLMYYSLLMLWVGGVLLAKLLNLVLPKEKKLNPMIGACGISAFPMSARVVYKMAIKEDPQNYLLMQCVGVNVSGQVASVIAGGLLLNLLVR